MPIQTMSMATPNRVFPLVEGLLSKEMEFSSGSATFRRISAVTLVIGNSDGATIVVDSAASTDFTSGDEMLRRIE